MPTIPNISRLSDDQLLASAIDLARRERSLNLKIIEHLREIGRRGLHLRHGYGSLFDYAVKELEFSEGSAYQRLQALKLSDEFPEVKQDMVEGDLSLTSVGYLQSAFDRHQRRWRQRAREQRRGGTGSALPGGDVPRDGGAGAAADALTGGGPPADGGCERVAGGPGGDGALADRPTGQAAGVLSADTSGGWPAGALAGGPVSARLSAAAKRELITRARGKSTRQVRELIAEFDPELVRPHDRLRALGRDRWEIKAVIDGECRRSLEQLLHWLSHVNPTMDYGELLQRVVADAVAKYDPARRAARGARPATAAPKVKAGEGSPVGERRSRGAAPAKVGDGSRGGDRRSRDAAITAATVGAGSRDGERRARHAADAAAEVGTGSQSGERRSHRAAAAAAEVSADSRANRHQPGEAEPVSAVVAVPFRSRGEHRDRVSAHQTVRHRNRQRPKDAVATAKCDPAQGPALVSRLAASAPVRGRRGQRGDGSPASATADRSISAASERETQAAEVVPAAVPGPRRSRSDQSGAADVRQPARNEGSRQRGATDNRSSTFAQRGPDQAELAGHDADGGHGVTSDREHGRRRRGVAGYDSCALAQEGSGQVDSTDRDADGGHSATSDRKRGGRRHGAVDGGSFAFAQKAPVQVESAAGSGAADGRGATFDQELGGRRHRADGGSSTDFAQEHRGVVASGGRGAGERRPRATITRAIPAAVRRHIWLRDGGRCTYRDPDSGRCCGAQHLLQIDHIQPFAIGGANSEGNLRLLCAAHNRARGRKQAAASDRLP